MRALILLLPTLGILCCMMYYAGKAKNKKVLDAKDSLLRQLHETAALHIATDLDDTFAVIVADEISAHYKRLERKKD